MIDARIDWNGGLVGGFTFGRSTFGGTDPFTSAWSSSFEGPYDNLSAIIERVSWSRGRDDLLTTLWEGQGEIVIVDEHGIYNPANDASPLAGKLVPMRPVFVTLPDDLGVTRTVFRGFLRDEPSHDAATIPARTTFQLVDMTIMLEGASPVIASTGPTTTGAAIGLLLDSIGLTDTNFRQLATGDPIPDFSADGSKSAYTLIQDLLTAERGVFFINGAGVAVYLDRHDRYERNSAATLNGVFSGTVQSGGSPIDGLANRQNVTGLTGGVQQYIDNNSVLANGPRDGDDIDSPYIEDATQAAGLARSIVARTSTVKPLSQFQAQSVAAGMTQGLVREIGDLITVANAGATGSGGPFYIERIDARYEATQLTVQWTVSKRTAKDIAFRFGLSQFAGTDPFRY